MSATVRREMVSGFEAYVLENPRVRAVVIPSRGGRIWEVLDRVRDRQWIWHREDVGLGVPAEGSIYDDVWPGGWEELFPNDAPCHFEGRSLPDHGEWWTTAWTVAAASEGPEALVRLVCESRIRRALCAKELRLAADADTIQVHYRIQSLESEPFHFLFKQHLPVKLSTSCALALPGGRVTAVDTAFGTLLEGSGPFDWPDASGLGGRRVNLSRIPSRSSEAREFVYVADLPESWCGIDDAAQGASLRLKFDQREMPVVWLFLSYGGWRGCYTAVLEPCTNMPKDLAGAVRAGNSARLSPGGVFQTRVGLTLRGLTRGD